MQFQNDLQAAQQGDNVSKAITETGAYTGIITMAEHTVSTKGTQGIELTFQNTDKQFARYLTMWTVNQQGQQIYGYQQLCGLMTILGVQGTQATESTINKYDKDQQKEVPTVAQVYQNLLNIPVGVLLEKEEYLSNSGDVKEKLNLKGFFNPETKQTVTEVATQQNSSGSNLQKMIDQLKDKKLPTQAQSSTISQSSQAAQFDQEYNNAQFN